MSASCCQSSCRHATLACAAVGAAAFLAAYFWFYTLSDASLRQFHETALRVAVLGYSRRNAMSVFLGVFEWAVWAAIFGNLFLLVSHGLHLHRHES